MMPGIKLKKSKVSKPQNKNRNKSGAQRKANVQKVALDQLAWTHVELPERLEDAEGFYQLEEIDDVDIIRDSTGNVEYLIHDKDQVDEEDVSAGEESEWEGFHDDSPTTQPLELASQNEKKPVKERPQRSRISDESTTTCLTLFDDQGAEKGIDLSAWSVLTLDPRTLSALDQLRFQRPTPIQEAAIPVICAGRDVIGKAPTGSGKTLAYGIPILEYILASKGGDHIAKKGEFMPTAFIISPTRELAKQLEDHLKALCSPVTSRARIATVTGGLAVQKQRRLLATADIIIGTPGRLWDVLNSTVGLLEGLRKIKFLVIDEADRLLSGGHFQEVEQILHALDRVDNPALQSKSADGTRNTRQTLVFSATFQRDLQQKLAGKSRAIKEPNSMAYLLQKLRFQGPHGKPQFLDVNPSNKSQLAPLLKEAMLECAGTEKDLYLYATLLLQPASTKTLVFTNSISSVRRLTLILQALQLPAHALHSQMQQRSRLKALERFSTGMVPAPASTPSAASNNDPGLAKITTGPILVATDVAARGLDIPSVHLVLHYHAPRTADMYIHRSGRTARADAAGTSILFCAPEEVVPVRRLAAKVHAQASAQRPGLRSARLDRSLVSRLRSRVALAARIASLEMDTARSRSQKNFMQEAAEDLGVDLDEEMLSDDDPGRQGKTRGKGKDLQAQVKGLRAELRAMLQRRVNVGVSERYLTAGGMDLDSLIRGDAGNFVGYVGRLEID